jgi:hypothetical protein
VNGDDAMTVGDGNDMFYATTRTSLPAKRAGCSAPCRLAVPASYRRAAPCDKLGRNQWAPAAFILRLAGKAIHLTRGDVS